MILNDLRKERNNTLKRQKKDNKKYNKKLSKIDVEIEEHDI